MDDTSQTLKPWVTFAGCVLVIVVLYWAQAVLVPIALAVLLTFVLTPAVGWLERWLGRVPSVLAAATLVFIVLGLAGWGLARQMDHLADDLPTYRVNILAKIADVRGAGKGGSVEKLQETIEGIKTDLGQSSAATGTASRPVMVTSERVTGFSGFSWLGPIVGPLGTAGLVLAMVIFMLLERRDLRDRLIGLFGHGQLTVTTKAFDEAGTRVSRQLLMQSLVNLVYGIAAGLGLYALGVPYPLVWATLGAALRFIPHLFERRVQRIFGGPYEHPPQRTAHHPWATRASSLAVRAVSAAARASSLASRAVSAVSRSRSRSCRTVSRASR
jgi:predicted PurR-regulated permease PerM